jgi:hypothetical protein
MSGRGVLIHNDAGPGVAATVLYQVCMLLQQLRAVGPKSCFTAADRQGHVLAWACSRVDVPLWPLSIRHCTNRAKWCGLASGDIISGQMMYVAHHLQEVYDSFANILYENVTRVRAGRPLLHTLVLPGGSGTEEASQSTRSLMSEEDEGLPPVAATGAAWGQADQGS